MSRRASSRILLSLAATAVALGVAELALRTRPARSIDSFAFLPTGEEGVFRFDPALLWTLDPSTERYDANRAGLRGYFPDGPRSESDFLVACHGWRFDPSVLRDIPVEMGPKSLPPPQTRNPTPSQSTMV